MTYLRKTSNDQWILLIRLLVGFVFISEGIQKFLIPGIRGVGRFEEIGIPAAEFLAYLTGSFEIICGILVLSGTYIRIAVIPLIVIMISAIVLTKVPVLLEKGFWEMAHAARTDLSMLICSIFLLAKGSGRYSLDKWSFHSAED